MTTFDVATLLSPVSPESPCGENLEYDPDYAAMEQAAAGKPEQQFGKTVIPGEEPNWVEVKQRALALLARTRDLRVAQYLVRAAGATDGLPGVAAGLKLLVGLVEQFWDGVHPQLDPDDDNDPTLRVNTIASLCDPLAMLRVVRDAPLVRSKLGTIAYRDVLVASGELPLPKGAQKVEQTTLDAAFTDCDGEALRTTAQAVCDALDATQRLEAAVTDRVGVSRAPNLQDLSELLKGMKKVLLERLALRGLSLAPVEPTMSEASPSTSGAAPAGDAAAAPAAGRAGSNGAEPVRLTGDFTTREDVIRALDKICEYYRRYEPSSPVPLFLNRAKRLASKSFLEILRDLTPDALNQALSLGGISDAEPDAEK